MKVSDLSDITRELYLFTTEKLMKQGLKNILETRAAEEDRAKELMSRILTDKERLLYEYPDLAKEIMMIEETGQITVFNAPFLSNYESMMVRVIFDSQRHLKYLMHGDKRLYYPQRLMDRRINEMYKYVCAEQDQLSPHRYLDHGEDLKDTVIFDCGCAEANFTLGVIDDVKAAYLFEGDDDWIRPLKATFTPWKDKVFIRKGFLGSGGEGTLSLREYMLFLERNGKLDIAKDRIFIKMDIEGAEPGVLEDIVPIMERAGDMRLAVCLYHNAGDEQAIRRIIPEDYTFRVRDGHMLFSYDSSIEYPYFRHGLMRIERGLPGSGVSAG